MQAFNALIIIQDSPGQPTHPIAPGGPPLYPGHDLPWGPGRPSHDLPWGPGQVTPPIYYPPYPSTGPGFPTNPIVIPPGAWAPNVPSLPIVLPPELTHPIVLPPGIIAPGLPTHPIVVPPPRPDQGLPGAQPGIDNTLPGQQPILSHPIVLPPVPPTGADDKALIFVKTVGQDGVWFILDKNSELKPGGVPQPKK